MSALPFPRLSERQFRTACFSVSVVIFGTVDDKSCKFIVIHIFNTPFFIFFVFGCLFNITVVIGIIERFTIKGYFPYGLKF